MSKTQILITDIENEKFAEGWPQTLESVLFKEQFPEIEPEFFSPLPFLHRIVIILRTDVEAGQVYGFLKGYLLANKTSHGCKVYLTESLISRPRARSFNDVKSDGTGDTKPVLRIDTSSYSVPAVPLCRPRRGSISSPSSLSPDQPISPTRVRLQDDQEEYFYMEPAPSKSKQNDAPIVEGSTSLQTASKPMRSRHITLREEGDGANDDGNGMSGNGSNRQPRSPSITITNMF